MYCMHDVLQLLDRDPRTRMGSKRDILEIKEHAWFKGLDWDLLMKKEIEPVYKPKLRARKNRKVQTNVKNGIRKNENNNNLADTSNFDRQFTNEPVVDSYDGDAKVEFADFTFQTTKNMILKQEL